MVARTVMVSPSVKAFSNQRYTQGKWVRHPLQPSSFWYFHFISSYSLPLLTHVKKKLITLMHASHVH